MFLGGLLKRPLNCKGRGKEDDTTKEKDRDKTEKRTRGPPGGEGGKLRGVKAEVSEVSEVTDVLRTGGWR